MLKGFKSVFRIEKKMKEFVAFWYFFLIIFT